MNIARHFDLTHSNTFGIRAMAEFYAGFSNGDELLSLLTEMPHQPITVLGGGSNILLTRDISGLVLHNEVRGIEVIRETATDIYLKVGAGEVWHDFVMHCVRRGWGGTENLSLIPGNVGASPMQNIGAYGVEIKDIFDHLEAFHIHEKYFCTFTREACHFGYRDSIFKNEQKHQFIITNVVFRLAKKPRFNTSYGAIEKQLELMHVKERSIKAISDAVIAIRQSKLPDPTVLGNAGSFFKNPVIDTAQFEQLQKAYPQIPHYVVDNGVKIPAAWLIDQCGFKGCREGNVGCYKKQPLVIVNYGDATGSEVFALSEKIINTVQKRFDIALSREVHVI